MAEPERLLRVDEELAALGKSDDDVEALCARVAGVSAGGLEAVDEQLEQLAAGVDVQLGQLSPDEDLFQEAPWGEGGAAAEPQGRAAGGGADALSADDLFGDDADEGSGLGPLTDDPTLSRPPPARASSPPPAGEDYGGGLADLLEGESSEAAAASADEGSDEVIEILDTDEFELLVDDDEL